MAFHISKGSFATVRGPPDNIVKKMTSIPHNLGGDSRRLPIDRDLFGEMEGMNESVIQAEQEEKSLTEVLKQAGVCFQDKAKDVEEED